MTATAMTASALAQSAPAPVAAPSPQATALVDYLSAAFLDLERKAANAYAEAFKVDTPLERLRDRLIFWLTDSGSTEEDGSKVLRGTDYEIRLNFGDSNYFDLEKVRRFRYELIRNGIGKGILPDIFAGTVSYAFRQSGHEVIQNLKLSPELLQMYQDCRSKTPILSVSPLSP